jgi:hypothetical protein
MADLMEDVETLEGVLVEATELGLATKRSGP